MSTAEARAHLSQKLVEAFSAQEEVYHIHFFGREAEGCSDPYSDIDMVVCSNDLVATKANYRSVFASIAPVRATFPLEGTPHSYSEMVLLEGYSPYHKVDFTIGDNTFLDWPAAAFPPLTVYENRQQRRESRTSLEKLVIRRGVEYLLTDILFSVARFTKCLFRRDLDMYRRWESISSNAALVALYEKHFGCERETSKRKLGSSEIRCLCEELTPVEAEQVHIIRPPNARLDLALSFKASIDLFIESSKRKAEHFGIALDCDLIDFIKGFLDSEVGRYQEKVAA